MDSLTSAAVELSPDADQFAQLARWILHEQRNVTLLIAAGCTREETRVSLIAGDAFAEEEIENGPTEPERSEGR